MASEISHFESSPHRSLVRVAGELDLVTAPLLRDVLQSADADPAREVVVELSAVTFMDCSGLAPLLEARAKLGERLRLSGLPRAVSQLLHLVGLDATFAIDGAAPTVRVEATSAPADDIARRRDRPSRAFAEETPQRRDGLLSADLPRVRPGAPKAQTAGAGAVVGTRVVIEQAIGLLMASLGCDAKHAARALRQIAWDHGTTVEDAAVALAEAAETSRTPAMVHEPAASAVGSSRTRQLADQLGPQNGQPLK